MAKKKTLSSYKKDLDTIFSQYIRQRDADFNGFNSCFTCGVTKYWKELDCGHFMSRRHLSTRWHRDNCEPQCKKCNIFNQGEQYKFGLNIDKKHGAGYSLELEKLSKQLMKFTIAEIKEQIEYYKEKVKKM